ncbi:MAG: glycosyltransferase [Bacteroides sp.]|nr:glycosyltransferase [Bacteroides sp.]
MEITDDHINETAAIYIEHIAKISKQKKPIVAIHCVTYNHGDYLREALEGFVMQQTTFPFVAIVHDDASTDNTAEVLREYADKYPDIILPIFETENQHSKKTLGIIMKKARDVTSAKYIAMCEGDDYWIDPLKLQKQVDYLELNPNFSMCFHSANLKYEKGTKQNKILETNYDNLQQREYSIDEIHKSFIVPACSVLLKTEVWDKYRNDPNYFVSDNVLWTACALCGRIFCFEDKMSVYRINNNGWTGRNNKTRELRVSSTKKWYLHYKALRNNYPEVSTIQMFKNELKYASKITYSDLKPLSNVIHNFKYFYDTYKYDYIKSLYSNIAISIGYKIKKLWT